jgi:hypothetical protein
MRIPARWQVAEFLAHTWHALRSIPLYARWWWRNR